MESREKRIKYETPNLIELEMKDGKVRIKGNFYYISDILEVDTVDDPDFITAATLTANTYMPDGTDLIYFMSADGGSNWEAVTLNSQHLFTYVGHELMWKAEFYGTPRKTAYIFDVEIDYEYTVVTTTPTPTPTPTPSPTETSGLGTLVSGFIGILTVSSLSIALIVILRKKSKK